jgi:hypothetical protein
MSITQRRASGSRRCHPLQFEQIGEQDDRVADRTTASESYRASVQMTLRAAALANETLATARTLVDRVRHQQPPTLEFLAQERRIDGAVQRSLAQTIRHLLADVRNAKLSLTCVLRRDGSASGLYRQFVNGARRTRPLVWGSQSV